MERISIWLGIPKLATINLPELIFLDTETSGLVGGSGSLVFLIGVGRFDQDGFHLAQYFLRDPLEEPAQLAGLLSYRSAFQGLVTYNGKPFDIPLLNARFILNGEASPFTEIAQLDLLPLARRTWRDRLPSRSLGNIEQSILGAVMRAALPNGWLQLAFLEADGQKACGYLNFDYNNHIWVYNSGLNFNYRELSPGWVLLGYLLKWANDNKRLEFDFMRGNEDYKDTALAQSIATLSARLSEDSCTG